MSESEASTISLPLVQTSPKPSMRTRASAGSSLRRSPRLAALADTSSIPNLPTSQPISHPSSQRQDINRTFPTTRPQNPFSSEYSD